MNNMQLDKLKFIFTITNAFFELIEVINNLKGVKDKHTKKVHSLHKIALQELDKTNPDIEKVNRIINEIELIVSDVSLKQNPVIFKPGGLMSKAAQTKTLK